MKDVRVRFAPSPTGFLHVGGARTAIFNWLFAKNRRGKFLLRIEDTDPERSKSELSEQILRSMKWLGMDADEAVVYQSDNITRYREVVLELIERGKAYYAFETSEELELKRKEAAAKKIQFKYNRASLKLDKDTVQKYLAEGREHTVRFFVPDGITEFEDIVHGKTSFNNSGIDDFVLLRSDSSPVYQIAVVVDDHDMEISHVIRGDDHLSNTPKQILIYEALGWEIPRFAHLPMILDEDKKKLSKRKNTVSAEEYKNKGYLPDALFNFLTLLGFAPENNREIVSREELIKMFTFERVNKKSAVFDMKKLNWINSEYIKMADENLIAELVRDRLIISNLLPVETCHGMSLQYLRNVIHIMKERVSTINDFTEFGKYFFTTPGSYDEKGLAKHWAENIKQLFRNYYNELSSLSGYNAEKLETHLRDFALSKGIKPAD
jgi:glutamyl-tRNA synthetase